MKVSCLIGEIVDDVDSYYYLEDMLMVLDVVDSDSIVSMLLDKVAVIVMH